MNKFWVLLTLTLVAPLAWSDGATYEVGYSTFSSDADETNTDLGGIFGSAGYRWDTSSIFNHTVEATVYVGTLDDKTDLVTFSIKPSYEIAYRGTWTNKNPGVSYFWKAMYGSFEVEAESQIEDFSLKADESGFGLGIGAEYRGITLGYAQYFGDLEDLNRIYIGYRFNY